MDVGTASAERGTLFTEHMVSATWTPETGWHAPALVPLENLSVHSFLAQRLAQEKGCQQVVWLDAVERRWVEELGGMNLFFVRTRGDRTQVVTPELSGTLLPGVTRNTILTLAEQLGHEVAEERISLSQWRDECERGLISESFACGTAAVVTPVGRVRDEDGDWTIGDGGMGPVTQALRTALVGVQRGWEPDPHGWRHTIR